jgi:hypothetical protein
MFMNDVAARLKNRVQLTSDGHRPYLEAVEGAFGGKIDYAMLVKIYGSDPEAEKRYSPAKCIGCESKAISGNPDFKHISTSYVERQNLSVRMANRRYTRLTNAFSKRSRTTPLPSRCTTSPTNLIKIHGTLRTTPAMAAGVTDRLWEVSDLVALLEASERRLERAA